MVTPLFSVPLLALMLGVVHAFEADHVAAVTTLAARSKSARHASLLGAFWGAGHTATLFVVGSVLLGFKVAMPESVSVSLERVVALMLIVLGTFAIVRARKDKLHLHTHEHGGTEHLHVHSHKSTLLHEHSHTSFLVGLVHGLAGSGALSLVALASTATLTEGMLFMLSFGVGSVLGMAFLSGGIGFLMAHAPRFALVRTGLQVASGLFSIVVALSMLGVLGNVLV